MSMRDLMMIIEGRIFEALDPTGRYNQQILDFLSKEGIDASIVFGSVAINRTSMVQYATDFLEGDAYTYVLELIKEELPDNLYITWAGRNDDFLTIDVYERTFSR